MRTRTLKILAPLAILTLATTLVSAAAPTSTEAEITKLEKAFNDSYGANDLDKYFSYYADDLVALFPEGRTDLRSYRKMWTEFIHAGNRLEPVHYSNLLVRVSPAGDSAIASYRISVRTRLADGKVTDEKFDETDVWMKRHDRWQVTFVHYSAAPPEKP